jgi:hypothetical protein
MSYVKQSDSIEEYIGESFVADFIKEGDNNPWLIGELLEAIVYDSMGTPVFLGGGTKSDDNMNIRIVVPYNITQDFSEDQYLILVYLVDSTNPDIRDVIAEYKVKYLKPKV